MLSGAAGLIAGFSAVSLPVLGVGRAATVPFISARLFTVVLMLGLGLLASGLLRFSLMKNNSATYLHPGNLGGSTRGIDSWKTH